MAVQRLTSLIFGGYKNEESSGVDDYVGKVPIHPNSQNATRAWKEIRVKQDPQPVTPMDPSTPISEDNIRFVCISDTHSQIEKQGASFIPDGDVVLHAGDFTQIGTPKAIAEFNTFLGSLPHKLKVVIAGNHDLSLDEELVKNKRKMILEKFNLQVHNFEDVLKEKGVDRSRDLLTNCIYLLDSEIDLCGVKVYGSPWQPWFWDWGFNLSRGSECLKKWDLIPDNTDILMTHGPPIGYRDACYDGCRAGCVELLTTIQTRVKPAYHIFGHIHEGYGIATDGHTKYINASTCTFRYKPHNTPIVFDFPIPEGRSKQELLQIPTNNLQDH